MPWPDLFCSRARERSKNDPAIVQNFQLIIIWIFCGLRNKNTRVYIQCFKYYTHTHTHTSADRIEIKKYPRR